MALVNSRLLLTAAISTAFAFLELGVSARADALKSPSDYSKEENKRVLNEIINQAQETLRTLDNPDEVDDPRAKRNRRERTQPRIVNGRGTAHYPATGALLKGAEARTSGVWCTGTLIAPDKFLTAAHCVAKDPRPDQYTIFLQSAGFLNVKAIDWQKEIYRFPRADIAILTLATPVLRIAPEAILRTERPIHGTLGTIVGFGRTGGFNEDYGVKREGFVETAACPQTQSGIPLICWNFSVEVQNGIMRSNTCNADSGGPLFVYEVTGGRQRRMIAGVTSGGSADDCLIGDQSYDVDLVEYAKWISETAKLIGDPVPAGPSPVLDTERDVSGVTSTLTQARPEISYPFDVREGTGTLMIAMNGDDNGRGRNNFDLYVIRTKDGADQVVCSEEGLGQFGFCQFNDPMPGAWKAVVKWRKGGGAVQTVVTQLPKPSP